MQIQTSSNTKTFLILAFSLAVVLIVSLVFSIEDQPKKIKSAKQDDPTIIRTIPSVIANLIKYNNSYLYKDENLFVFATQDGIVPNITFAYKAPLSVREINDRVFIDIFLNDPEAINTPFYGLTFKAPKFTDTIIANGQEYLLFTKPLVPRQKLDWTVVKPFKDDVISFKEIKHINLGRHNRTKGKSLNLKQLFITDDKTEKSFTKILTAKNTTKKEALGFKTIIAYTQESKFKKIRSKRKDALEKGILLSEDGDFIKGEIQLDSQDKLKTIFRLKGDWLDHLYREKQWSYRFIIQDDKTLMGMRKFSIQHPKTRKYQWEWLFNKVVKDEGIIGLRYDFVYFKQYIENKNGLSYIDNKIMALEESFDKILIENNKKREGVIIAFDESMLWKDTQLNTSLGLEKPFASFGIRSFIGAAKIKVFNENKVLANPALKKQFIVAKALLEGLKHGTYKISEVFDVDKLTTYVALCNLFGGKHGLVWHNLRIYYNPITNKLEPISFDSGAGNKIGKILNYPFSKNDSIYKIKLAEKLKLISSQAYIDKIIQSHGNRLNEITEILQDTYTQFTFDIKTLEYNSNVIKKIIFPRDFVLVDFIELKNDKIFLEVNNLNNFYAKINSLEHLNGKKLDILEKNSIWLKPKEKKIIKIDLNKYFNNAFVSKKNKKGGFTYPKDIDKLIIAGEIDGVGLKYKNTVGKVATSQNLDKSISMYRKKHSINYSEFDFIKVKENSNIIVFEKGSYTISKSIKIPKDKVVLIEPGFNLNLIDNASFISQSTLVAKGTKEEPITFFSNNNTGGGLFINDAETQSELEYCTFNNLSNPNNEIWSVSGAVNFNESNVVISNCVFKNNRCEDALNIIRSNFTMVSTEFHDTYSDSFDGDFVTGTIDKCQFYNSGNDAIDVSGSQLMLRDILISNPLDKGISAGEASLINGESIQVIDGEIGIVSKDLSKVILENVLIKNTRLGFSSFQKKYEYGKASIDISKLSQINNETNFLIETGCRLTINKKEMSTISSKVIEQMYGAEYGKSSK